MTQITLSSNTVWYGKPLGQTFTSDGTSDDIGSVKESYTGNGIGGWKPVSHIYDPDWPYYINDPYDPWYDPLNPQKKWGKAADDGYPYAPKNPYNPQPGPYAPAFPNTPVTPPALDYEKLLELIEQLTKKKGNNPYQPVWPEPSTPAPAAPQEKKEEAAQEPYKPGKRVIKL